MSQKWEFRAELPGEMLHTIQVQPDHQDVDFNLYIVSADGQTLAEDTGPEAGAECSFVARQDTTVFLQVVLLRGQAGFSVHASSRPVTAEPEVMAPPLAANDPAGILTPDEIKELLLAHNAWRARYGVPSLQWSDDLAAFAQDWANQLAVRGMHMQHRSPNPYGENLYWASGKRSTPIEVVDAWGNEEQYYDPARNNWWPRAGHFSQVIWKTTQAVGGGVVRLGGQEIWVCNYHPRGNWRGERPY